MNIIKDIIKSYIMNYLKKIILAVIVSVILSFAWGAFSHMVLPWHMINSKSFSQNGTLVANAVKVEAVEPGFYMLPNFDLEKQKTPEAREKWIADSVTGPYAFLSIHPQGRKVQMGMGLFYQFLTYLLVSLMVVLLYEKLKIKTVFEGALFVSAIVTSGAIMTQIPLWIWWGFPFTSTLISIVDTSFTWFLAGLGIGIVLSSD